MGDFSSRYSIGDKVKFFHPNFNYVGTIISVTFYGDDECTYSIQEDKKISSEYWTVPQSKVAPFINKGELWPIEKNSL